MIANSKKEIINTSEHLKQERLKIGLRVNSSNTSTMTEHVKANVKIQDDELENLRKFKLLESCITEEGNSIADIEVKIRQANCTVSNLSDVRKSKDMGLKLQVLFCSAVKSGLGKYRRGGN